MTRAGGLTRLIAASAVGGLLAAGLALGSAAPAFAVDPVAGALTSGDSLFPNQGNGGYDALHYDVDLKVNVAVSSTANAVATTTFPEASTTIQATTTGSPLSSYAFDFQGSSGNLAAATLNVTSVTVDGVPASFSRIENTTTSNATTDVHKLIVTPAAPVDGAFTTVVTYSGTPVRHTDTDGSAEGWNNTTDGATFLNQPVGAMTAFPNNNTPSDKATYTFTIDAPTKLNTSATAVSANPGLKTAGVASNGELVSRTASADGSRTTWVWDETEPMASELSMISIGRYDLYESDLALASGRTLHEWTFIDPAISVANQTTTLSTRAQLKSMFDFMESKYGPYPGNSFGIVTDVVPGAINYALETQDRPFFPNSAGRGTTYHEFMHQWFGNGVAPVDWNDIWLNEGPATYAETQVPYESSGASTNSGETSLYNSWNSTAPASSLWTVPTAAMTQASQLFGPQVYTRGSMTLAALRTVIGDASFEDVMYQWQTRYTGRSKRTADFIALAQEISGRDLAAFFNAWIYTSGKPAWPAKFNLSLTGPTAPVSPGASVGYVVSSRNTGKVVQNGSVVTVDLTDLLDDATIGSLPANTSLDGTTLTWNVPSTALAATSSVTLPFTVNPGTDGSTLRAVARASTLGSTCVGCAPSVVVGVAPVDPAPVPTIIGTPTVGVPLSADTAGWPAGTTFTYQWTVDGSPVPGATAATYSPTVWAVGLPVRVVVTGSQGAAAPATRTSDPTANVARPTQPGSTPTVSGTPQFGKAMSVDVGTWEPGTYFTYQWLANAVSIAGATGPVYVPAVATQLGQTISVNVTATKAGQNSLVKSSSPTTPVAAGVFGSTPTPTIIGTPRALSPLTALPGQWDDGTTLAYQWQVDGSPVGTNSATYTPTVAQIGLAAAVTVTGTKPGYPTTVRPGDPTVPIAPAAQVLQPTPTITGTGKVDAELAIQPGTWDAGTAQTYQWLADGTPIDAATGLTYTPGPAMLGAAVTASVTSSRTSYATVVKTTAPTTVTAGDLVATPTPTVTGTPAVGMTLTAAPGAWDDGVALGYLWAVDGTDLVTETTSSYAPSAGDVGKTVTVEVTGTKAGYAIVTRESVPTDPVALGTLTLTPTPTISGTPKVGDLLAAEPGTWDDGTTFGYQWTVAGADVTGATGSTYSPVAGDLGQLVTVEVTGTKSGYTSVTRESAATSAVASGSQGSTPIPTVAGTPKVGQPLTANAGSWDGGVALAYQWTVAGADVTGATGTTYTPEPGDLGEVVRIEVTGTRTGFDPVTVISDATAEVALGDLLTIPVPQLGGSVAKVGVPLTALPGTWDGGVTLAYQWTADDGDIPGETGTTFTPGPGDVGASIAVKVTGSKLGYASVTTPSAGTSPVARGTMTLTPAPSISGSPTYGQTLTAVPGAWDAGTSLAYQWLVSDAVVGGATGPTFDVRVGDVGSSVRVIVTGSKTGYDSVARASGASDPVSAAALPTTLKVKVGGKPRVGKKLRAKIGSWPPDATISYVWRVGGKLTSTRPSWKVPASARGKKVTLRVTVAVPGYLSQKGTAKTAKVT